MSKRRFISQLPAVYQTPDLATFFGATVDEVFQPGTSERLSGYIGHTLSGSSGFPYIGEPDAKRAFYQLEPAMVSHDDTGAVKYALSYPDLVSYLQVSGGNVNNQQRLFETSYYAWSPPINPDMLINYHQYYWFGDTSLTTPLYYLNPEDRNYFVALSDNNTTAYTNHTTPSAIRSTSVPAGSWYVEVSIAHNTSTDALIYCGLANQIDDIKTLPGQDSGSNAVALCNTGIVYTDGGNIDLGTSFAAGDTVGIAWSTFSKEIWFRINDGAWNTAAANPSTGVGGLSIDVLLQNGSPCVLWAGKGSSCQSSVNFGASTFAYEPPTGFVGPATNTTSADLPILTLTVPTIVYPGNGSQTQFELPGPIKGVPTAQERPVVFVNNVQVQATQQGAFMVLATAPADGASVRVTRTPDLASVLVGQDKVEVSDINTRGVKFLSSGMRIKIVDAVHSIGGWDSTPWDYVPWDSSGSGVYLVDGIGRGLRLTADDDLVRGLAAQYVTVDRSTYDENTRGWANRNLWVHRDSFAWNGTVFAARQATRPIIEFVRDLHGYPQQTWSESIAPLFMLYDLERHALNDPSFYPSSTFSGNRLFGYASSNTTIPLNLITSPQVYDANGYICFNNDAASERYFYSFGSTNPVVTQIIGLTQYGTVQADGETIGYQPFWHPAAKPTAQPIRSGFYEVPAGLRANPDYLEVGDPGTGLVSRSTFNAHFSGIISAQTGFAGDAVADNNYRDSARDLTVGTRIVQHNAPLLKTMLLSASGGFDFIAACRYVENEYQRFRSRFARQLLQQNRDGLTPADPASAWVSSILRTLRMAHNSSFPFALSNVAGGQYFIPATPTVLGMQPAAVPAIITDPTYGEMILGHDGSLTAVFGDWRDAIILALETQIYLNMPTLAWNFDGSASLFGLSSVPPLANEARPTFDLQAWIGTAFYTPANGYSWSEANAIIAPMFELWAQTNNLNYRSNDGFDSTDAFTWNYRGIVDRRGHMLPGHWRAIYRFYYDTEAPHKRPWEMLGFVDQPNWWTTLYGTNYGRSNPMWLDLAAGRIRRGLRAGIDARYQRPGLLDLIPVNQAGDLLDPVEAGIVATNVSYDMATRDWQAGDGAPVETKWRLSPAYRFALTRASFLMKPSRFVEQSWDALNVGFVGDQWVETKRLVRPSNARQYVHAEINPDSLINPTGQPMTVYGISQWIADYLASKGQSSASFGAAVRGLSVNLMHQMAGFVTNDSVQVAADSFGVLPSENVDTIIYASPAKSTQVYSGVIIEWTGSGWTIFGYDGLNPSFTIIPPNTTGPKGLISLAQANEPSIVPWRPNTYYPNGILVSYQNSVYECSKSHTSTSVFEQHFWTARPDLSTAMILAPRVITYQSGLATTVQVPYGTVYTNYQDIANFLLGYERWLIAQGWSFSNTNATGQLLNWSLSVYEFLSWAQVQWSPGNFIALSPGQSQLQFDTAQGTILNVEDNTTGFFGLLNRLGQPISQRNSIISRLDGALTISATDNDIFLARLEICSVEHALVLSNTTVFDDVIYLPLYDTRQERLLLNCNRATGWAGRIDAPGFIVNADGTLASSFEKAANDVRYAFDVEQSDVSLLRDYARHNIGMQITDYFNNLLMSPNTQFEFYQGMIQSKGSPVAFDALTRSKIASNSPLEFLEEWGVRLGTFGSPFSPFLSFQVIQDDFRADPQFIRFQQEDFTGSSALPQTLTWIQLGPNDSRWHDTPPSSAFFPETKTLRPSQLPNAGPVRLSEVTASVLSYGAVTGLYDNITVDRTYNTLPTGSRVWVYDGNPAAAGLTYYVNSATGDDGNTGLTLSAPWRTLQHAHDNSQPGDTIFVADGTYRGLENASNGTPVLRVTRTGTQFSPITYKAMPGAMPIISATKPPVLTNPAQPLLADAVQVVGASYIVFDGFEIVGGGALAGDDPHNGISIFTQNSSYPQNITIANCRIHDCPYNGILVQRADYITVSHNKVFNNGLYSSLNGSGINIQQNNPSDAATSNKIIVSGNICWNNSNTVTNTHTFTGGHGIVLSNNSTYAGRSLVCNNLCFNNGGSGILLSGYQHADVLFNTASHNQSTITVPMGEITATSGYDINIVNNIMVASSAAPVATDLSNIALVSYDSNLANGGHGEPMPGRYLSADPLFSSASDFTLRLGSPAIGAANARFTVPLDLFGNQRATAPAYDLGCYQTRTVAMDMPQPHPFQVYRSFDIGQVSNGVAQPLTLALINTPSEDAALVSMRIYFQSLLSLSEKDVGNYLVIDGLANTTPELQGLQLITAVHTSSPMAAATSGSATSPTRTGSYYAVDVQAVGQRGSSFIAGQQIGHDIAPVCRVLRSVRFPTVEAIDEGYYNFVDDDLVWIDDYNASGRWAVLRRASSAWQVSRVQPHRIDTRQVAETVIYQAGTQISNQKMILNQPVVPVIDVIDPMAGLLCNISQREINFMTADDPANYNAGFGALHDNGWGPDQVGMVWWNLATARFLDPFTDTLGVSTTRDLAELQYRIIAATTLAPNTSADVYEWIASPIDPITYAANGNAGTVYNADSPAYVQATVYNAASQTDATMYYFWVSGLTVKPNLPFRNTDITTVANGIVSPSALGVAWMSPISRDGLLLSGVFDALNETSTIMKIALSAAPDAIGVNDEWLLMQEGNSSLPPEQLWSLMRDSLAQFSVVKPDHNRVSLRTLPDPHRSNLRNTGIFPGQAMFTISQLSLNGWQNSQTYFFGDQVSNNGYAYTCTRTGVSQQAASGAAVPSGPTGFGDNIIDGSTVWAYYGPDPSRGGLIAARAAFIASVNSILAAIPVLTERVTAATNLYRTTYLASQAASNEPGKYLIWSAPDSSYPWEPPPSNEFDVVVYSIGERNDLLGTPQFINASGLISVLINGMNSAKPFWSIWLYDPAIARPLIDQRGWDKAGWDSSAWDEANSILLANADNIFSLKPAYDYKVSSETERNGLIDGAPNVINYQGRHVTLALNDRVLVVNDSQANGFWTIWKWTTDGFVLWQAQTYDTSTFIETINWYDTATLASLGFSPSNPPQVSYTNALQRDAIEGSKPTNLLVALTDEAIWTAYINNAWQTVEMDKMTLQLSTAMADPTRPVYAVSTDSNQPLDLTSILRRDGSWELRILTHVLFYSGLLTAQEINRVWFDMLTFAHVQQNEVDWAFKTSFINVLGFSTPLTQTPSLVLNQNNNIIDYLGTVKPYRVKVREITSQYTPDNDRASAHVTDFDNPLYYDASISSYRSLDPNDVNDKAILASKLPTNPWSDWYNQYLGGNANARSITVTVLFDRLSPGYGNFDLYPFDWAKFDVNEADFAAAYRIMSNHYPAGFSAASDPDALQVARAQAVYQSLGLAPKWGRINGSINYGYDSVPYDSEAWDGSVTTVGSKYDGGALDGSVSDQQIMNGAQTSRPGGLDLRAPYYGPDHPEERVPFGADDAFVMTVTSAAAPGMPRQVSKVFDVSAMSGTATVYHGLIAQSAAAVMVYRDGVRAVLGTDYTVDYFARTVTVNLLSGQRYLAVQAVGFGSITGIEDILLLSYGSQALTLPTVPAVQSIAVVVDGSPLAANGYSLSGSTVSLTSPPSNGADVAVIAYTHSRNTAVTLNSQSLTASGGETTITLTHPDVQTMPPHAGVIIEKNGRRLSPPATCYGSMTVQLPWFYLPISLSDQPTVTIYVNGTLYSAAVPYCTRTSKSSSYPFKVVVPNGQTPATNIAGQFVLWKNLLIALDTNFTCHNIAVVINNLAADYSVSSDAGTVTLSAALTAGDKVVITTFDNAEVMGIRTVSYPLPANWDDANWSVQAWDATTTTMTLPAPSGSAQSWVSMNGHHLVAQQDYEIVQQTITTKDVSFETSVLRVLQPISGSIVATSFTGPEIAVQTNWLYTTKTASFERMYPADKASADLLPVGFGADINYDSYDFSGGAVYLNHAGTVPSNVALFSIKDKFETLRLSPYAGGTLVTDLGPSASSFQVNLFLQPLAAELQDSNPLPIPDIERGIPGVVWIDGERIEYFGYARTNNQVTLSSLRRATRGTSMGAIRLCQTATVGAGNHDFTFAKVGVVDVSIKLVTTVDGQTLIKDRKPTSVNIVQGQSSTIVTIGVTDANSFVNVGLTIAATHFGGASVWNGCLPTIDPPVPTTAPPGGPFGMGYSAASGQAVGHSHVLIHAAGHASGAASVTGHNNTVSLAFRTVHFNNIEASAPDGNGSPLDPYSWGSVFFAPDSGSLVLQSWTYYCNALDDQGSVTLMIAPWDSWTSTSGKPLYVGAAQLVAEPAFQPLSWQPNLILQGGREYIAFIKGDGTALSVASGHATYNVLSNVAYYATDVEQDHTNWNAFGDDPLAFSASFGDASEPVVGNEMSFAYHNNGTITVGVVENDDATLSAAAWDASGSVTLLSMLGQQDTAKACSADGSIIVGFSDGAACYWRDGDVTALPMGDDMRSLANDCSASGDLIVGVCISARVAHAVYWTDDTMHHLPCEIESTYVQANACSSDGRFIVGQAGSHAVCWDLHADGTMTVLPSLAGGSMTVATDCSADGSIIVGHGKDGEGQLRGVYWQHGTIHQLEDLSDRYVSTKANAVSDDGSIIAGLSYNDQQIGVAVYWSLGQIKALPVPFANGMAKTWVSVAHGVSPDGSTIVGATLDANDNPHWTTWTTG